MLEFGKPARRRERAVDDSLEVPFDLVFRFFEVFVFEPVRFWTDDDMYQVVEVGLRVDPDIHQYVKARLKGEEGPTNLDKVLQPLSLCPETFSELL
jgi:hypothetical protein